MSRTPQPGRDNGLPGRKSPKEVRNGLSGKKLRIKEERVNGPNPLRGEGLGGLGNMLECVTL